MMEEIKIPTYDYWVMNSVFNKQEIIDINNHIDSNFDYYESTEDAATGIEGEKKKYSKVKCIQNRKIQHIISPIFDTIYKVNNHNVGWDLYPLEPSAASNLNYYNTENGGKYDWHRDTDESLTDIKYTLLINLSTEEYEGGEFQLFNGGEMEIPELNTPGNVVWFKSFIDHRVLPVTKGERKTLATWILGPKFK